MTGGGRFRHTVVVDLGFGDCGKGTVVDWLCRGHRAEAVVRFNGGAQAAHNVVAPDGRHHTFAQLGAGTFVPGVLTHLSRFTLVDPLALAAEADHLAEIGVPDALDRLTVDRRALLTTPYHRAANRARETARGTERHGSCGMGIGETARYALAEPDEAPTAGDCAAPRTLRRKLAALRDRLTDELGPLDAPPVEDCAAAFTAFAESVALVGEDHLPALLAAGPVVFEGAQGVLLDEWRGFHPYTTWSTTTAHNALELLAEAGDGTPPLRLGVLRTTTTRHGPGPLVTEDAALTAALPEAHNGPGRWQGAFRVGHFDAVAHAYATAATGGVDEVALTHLDAPARAPGMGLCTAYRIDGELVAALEPGPPGDLAAQARLTERLLRAEPVIAPAPADWPEAVAEVVGAPVTLLSSGPRATDKRDLGVGRTLPSESEAGAQGDMGMVIPAAPFHESREHEEIPAKRI
ncbi:adenylosuccinate synthetase [Allonocardiopsis opalescens]|uniref:Adenylosuccinate synthetase n=1 Tax=Allonocardiopsis opalescens TaxID=1144618 RepID=A0A2T0PX12_9ACTN|nr:adenylosuccinate synthetase [Allonocardiopsis opalescens]PRX96074.1 adenylosuccinate synthase [Allonocardiopsis opalescens]